MIASPTLLFTKTIKVLFFLFLVFCGLYFGRAFLIPLTLGGILAMLFLPVSRKLEEKGIHKALAPVICILLLVLFFVGIGGLLVWQVSDLAGDITGMEKRISDAVNQLRNK